jgi:glyoxylase-like metal-dependent hydrolase (beta-lactamase superfamily II)
MKKVDIPAEEAVPLGTLTPGVAALRTLIVNVAALSTADGWVLIDAGLAGYAGAIIRWARDTVSASPPSAIVLTHGHFDHVGAIDGLLREWDVPV